MNTITIPDPLAVQAMLKAEFPDAISVTVSYNALSRGPLWMLSLTWSISSERSGVDVSDPDLEIALSKLRSDYQNFDPLAHLRERAAEKGMKLVPA